MPIELTKAIATEKPPVSSELSDLQGRLFSANTGLSNLYQRLMTLNERLRGEVPPDSNVAGDEYTPPPATVDQLRQTIAATERLMEKIGDQLAALENL